jgi:hypothetical protein
LIIVCDNDIKGNTILSIEKEAKYHPTSPMEPSKTLSN